MDTVDRAVLNSQFLADQWAARAEQIACRQARVWAEYQRHAARLADADRCEQ